MQKLLLPLMLAALISPSLVAQTLPPAMSAAQISLREIVEPAAPLTLETALDFALKANPEIAIARREIQATEGTIQQAGTILNPEIAAFVEDTRRETRTSTVQLNQPIELGGKRLARVNAAERGRDVAVMELAAREADVRATVISVFYEVVTAQERLRLGQDTARLAQRATDIASRRVTAGKVSPVEETRARVAESGVRIELIQAANELESTRRKLAATWGNLTPRFDHAEDAIGTLPASQSFNDLAQRLQQSPGLLRARGEVERRLALSQVERTRQTPNVTVSLGIKRDEQLGRNQAIVGFSVPLPLFDRNQGNVLEALRRTDKARDELLSTEVTLNAGLSQAYGRLSAMRKEVDLIQTEILPGALSAYEATTKGFELGKFSFLDVLDAQRTYFQAKSQYLRAFGETHRAAADIERLLGVPSAAINTQRSP
jgi:cobalt-zinc-cadmium efflux system outer membrane protein